MFNDDNLYIQGMDRSHICLFDIKILKNWFGFYEKKEGDVCNICLDTTILYNVLSMCNDNLSLIFEYNGEPDSIDINCINDKNKKGEYDKFFHIPLTDTDSELFSIPETEYDAEFIINTKKINDIISQLNIFGDNINIKCLDDNITLSTNGTSGDMTVKIQSDDLDEYSITEDKEINVLFNLVYIQKMCINTKISNDVCFSIGNDIPMKIKYDLGEDSYCVFFIAPKIDDD